MSKRWTGISDDRVIGFYDACKLLSTSPRFNKPARDVLEDVTWEAIEELKKRGLIAERGETE